MHVCTCIYMQKCQWTSYHALNHALPRWLVAVINKARSNTWYNKGGCAWKVDLPTARVTYLLVLLLSIVFTPVLITPSQIKAMPSTYLIDMLRWEQMLLRRCAVHLCHALRTLTMRIRHLFSDLLGPLLYTRCQRTGLLHWLLLPLLHISLSIIPPVLQSTLEILYFI